MRINEDRFTIVLSHGELYDLFFYLRAAAVAQAQEAKEPAAGLLDMARQVSQAIGYPRFFTDLEKEVDLVRLQALRKAQKNKRP